VLHHAGVPTTAKAKSAITFRARRLCLSEGALQLGLERDEIAGTRERMRALIAAVDAGLIPSF
jgi:hypothetical protein